MREDFDLGVSIISSFTISILLAPFSIGFFIFLISIILLEIVYASSNKWRIKYRAAIIVAAILGFIIGRTVIQDEDILRGGYKDNMITNKMADFLPGLDPDIKKRYMNKKSKFQ
uniref:Uncharacterized protein n=1 Tax=Pithovirus LCPAC104 TaxID=2506589 RepID=A0A481Z3Z2_9VIRU|nr:MAG: hypothetical protein LCPAC104_00700 [Pithovirus LCPAC104]